VVGRPTSASESPARSASSCWSEGWRLIPAPRSTSGRWLLSKTRTEQPAALRARAASSPAWDPPTMPMSSGRPLTARGPRNR
jgi:hypothetical protein